MRWRKDKNFVNSVYVCDSVSVCAIIRMFFFPQEDSPMDA